MKKNYFIFLLLFSLFLQGCLTFTQKMHINRDGSGLVTVDYCTIFPVDSLAPGIADAGLFSEDSIRAHFSYPGVELLDVSLASDKDDGSRQATISMSFSSLDSLMEMEAFRGANFSFRKDDDENIRFSQTVQPTPSVFGADTAQTAAIYKFTVSGKILEHNADSLDGEVMIWEYSLGELEEAHTINIFFAPYKLDRTPVWIYYAAGFVLLVVFFFLLRSKRK